MRFDDSLTTVLSADTATPFGAQSAWRQLVDLMAWGRVADAPAMDRLRALRPSVPVAVRAATARALAFAAPSAALVAFFAEDELAIAAPVLRTASLDAADWQALLPLLTPTQRSVLRHRRDLPGAAVRGLESFGASDLVLPFGGPANDDAVPATGLPARVAPVVDPANAVTPAVTSTQHHRPQLVESDRGPTPFVALGEVARGLPVVAEALRRAEARGDDAPRFEISDLVARIDAFNRTREDAAEPVQPRSASGFRFETDSSGTIRWVDGAPRAALIGASIAGQPHGPVAVDGGASGAFRQRTRFERARMDIGGTSDAAGTWRVSAMPVFDRASGRFVGYRGTARRPRADEQPAPSASHAARDGLRQLVHELRTPANAVAGFAELIESELLGPVAAVHRDRASTIRMLAGDLVGAIEDLDTAARIEGDALDLRAGNVALGPMLARVVADLRPLATLRGVDIAIGADPVDAVRISADDRATERLLARLMAAVVSAGGRGERLAIATGSDGQGMATIAIDRPVALADPAGGTLFAIDAERESEAGAPLLGTGFALRLARNLAQQLGGSLAFEAARLTVRLPLASAPPVEQASTS